MFFIQIILSLPEPLKSIFMKLSCYGRLVIWHSTGKPLPPPKPVKTSTILEYAKKYKIKNFIETGTYLGETIELTKKYFNQIYSVELSKDLYLKAKKIFQKDKKIKIIHGDSALVLNKLVKNIKKPYVFWLDAHYSGGITAKGSKETPILKELQTISNSKIKDHIILIDDAREFTRSNDYPSIKKLRDFVTKKFPNYKVVIKNDIIQIYPCETDVLEK